MAKQSSVQITCKVDGDGVDARFEPPPAVNVDAPASGPERVTLAAGTWTQIPVPAGAKGVVIAPGTAPDAKLQSFVGDANGYPLDVARSTYLALGDPATFVVANTLILFSTAGGTVSVMWT